MRGKPEAPEIRFWTYVQKANGCWPWLGGRRKAGYGLFNIRPGKIVSAHRFMYESVVGPIPAGQWVLHKCDNPACVNPDHLYLGDRSRNMKDASERGRIDMKYVASFPRPGKRKKAISA